MIEVNKIYNENCIETLRRIPDNFVNLVVTSPPYNMNLRIRNGKYCSRQIVKEFSTKYEGFDDNMPIEEYYDFHLEVLRELLRTSGLIFYNIQIVTGSKRAIFKIIGELSDYLMLRMLSVGSSSRGTLLGGRLMIYGRSNEGKR